MKKNLLLFFLICVNVVFAQKADFKSCFKYSGDNLGKYYHSTSIGPGWINRTNFFWYSFTTTHGIKYYIVDAQSGKRTEMFSVEKMARELTEHTGQAFDLSDFRIGGIEFPQNNPWFFTFTKNGHTFEYSIKTGVLKKTEKADARRIVPDTHPYWQKFSPDSNFMVYAYKHNLYLQKRGDTTSYPLTTDGEQYYSYAASKDKNSDEKVAPMITWAGDSKIFYSLRQDRRNVEECWIVDNLAQPRPTLRTYKFPMPGEKNVFTYDLHLFNPDSLKHIVVDIAKYPDQEVKVLYFNFNQNPDYIYFTRKSRTCDKMDLCLVNVKTGGVSEIISETSAPYFTEQLFDCRILNNGEDIIWWSERTGWGQYYLYNKEGKLKNRITSGDFVACRITEMDTLDRWFIFEGYGKEKGIDPNYRFYYRVNFDGSGLTLLTPGDGHHSINISKNGNYLVDTYSRVDMEPCSVVRDMSGKEKLKLDTSDLSLLYTCGWKKPQKIKVKAADGITDLYGVMYVPFNMDTTRKYPVITNVYPGPQEDLVPTAFSVDDNYNQSLAQLGFIVVNVGSRGGSFYRGKNYYNFGYGNLRDYALPDNKFMIEQLADRYSFIDLDKVGIYGHSGGGFMAAAAILTYPDFYKVAVAASGNHDNNIYTKWWGEMYHGVKMKTVKEKDTEDKFEFESRIPTNMELAKNLEGKLFLITGDVDINVHPAHTIRLADALMKANKRFDLMIIPGADHGLGTAYYINLIRYYFVENLLGQPLNNVDMYDVE